MTIWQEGDIVGPTNLNTKVPSWFGSANTASSASSVINGIVNVKDFGAAGDQLTDDYASIQSAFSFMMGVASGNSTPVTYLPPGWYKHSKPFEITRGFQPKIMGGGRVASTVIQGTYRYGPELVIASGYTIPIVGNLLSGGTSAYSNNGVARWFNLSDSPTLELSGLTAFTAEGTYKVGSISDNYNIVASSGKAIGCDPILQAFGIRTLASGGATAAVASWLCTNASNKTVTSASTIAVGGQYHFALSWGGSVVSFYINGTNVGTAAATGTLTQGPTEDVTVGHSMQVNPDANTYQTGLFGTLDSLRISNIARYGANFTAPTAKFSNDSNTLMLMNFEQQTQVCSLARTKDGDCWLWMRYPTGSVGVIDAYLKDFELYCGDGTNDGRSGIFADQLQLPHLDNIRVQAFRRGIHLLNNSYEGRLQDLYLLNSSITSVSKYGLVIGNSSGVNELNSINLEGSQYPLVVLGSSVIATNLFVATNSFTKMGIVLSDSPNVAPMTLVGTVTNAETGIGSTFSGMLVITGTAAVDCSGGEWKSGNSVAPVLVDSAGAVNFYGGLWSPPNPNYPLVSVSQTTRMPAQAVSLFAPSFGTTPQSITTQANLVALYGVPRSLISQASAFSSPFVSVATTNSSGNSVNLLDSEMRVVAVSATSAQIAIRSGNTTYLFNAAGTAV